MTTVPSDDDKIKILFLMVIKNINGNFLFFRDLNDDGPSLIFPANTKIDNYNCTGVKIVF